MSRPPRERPTAVALSYADRGKAPVVVAKGYGVTADSIMRVAREHDLYVHASSELVGLLMQVNLDREIPPSLYLAVAEVMAWVARVDAKAAQGLAAEGKLDRGQESGVAR